MPEALPGVMEASVPVSVCVSSAVPRFFNRDHQSLQLGMGQLDTMPRQVFSAPPRSRQSLALPHAADVDFRASCFCHKRLIDLGFVCSVRLNSHCVYDRFRHTVA